MRRALITGARFPEIDRDCGSQRIDEFVKTLADDGWSVTYLATETDGDQRHAHRLRQHGVATFQGADIADEVIEHGDFDVALLSAWKPSSRLLPIVRERSPRTKVIVDSVDLNFLREARRQFGLNGELDEGVGKLMANELNLYRAVDAVLSVSSEEGSIMSAFLGPNRVYELPLTDNVGRRDVPFEERRGMFFVGNFRHLPNGEAIEYLCKDILPQVDPSLLAEHPLFVAGSRLDDKIRAHARGLPHTRIAGWIPSVVPYLAQTRIAVIPLLHGAGVKGKVLEALMAGTPVITTPIGAEGLGLVHGEHALIASTPTDFAAAIARLLTDATSWQQLSDAGYEHVSAKHDPKQVAAQLREIVDGVMARPAQATGDDPFRHGRRRELAYNATIDGSAATLATVTDPGSLVSVVSRGDDALLDIRGRTGRHFPAHPDGRWAGYYPADSDAAIADLESEREKGARYLAFPSTSFWWLHHYRELATHLDARYRKVHSDVHLVLYDLRERARVARRHQARAARPRIVVVGTYNANLAGPPPSLAAELERSEHFVVVQQWAPAKPGAAAEPAEPAVADWLLFVDDSAVLPSGFVDDFFSIAEQLAELGVERLQPAHSNGPTAGPPITESQRGVLARELSGRSPLPVFAIRSGASPDGAVTVVDAVQIGLARALTGGGDPLRYSHVLDVFLPGIGPDEPPRRAVRRGKLAPNPLVSVLVSTYDRPELLSDCLESLCSQSLPGSDFEVVVVDDGTPGAANDTDGPRAANDTDGPRAANDTVFDRFHDRLALTWVAIDHTGRGGAKNLAAMLARADIVLWFDDDDRADSDMLAEHLAGHEEHPEESAAILGYTGWAPELTVSPLMHYLTDVDKMLFAYGNLQDGQELDWRGFWEGRISSKRALHLRHGLHDQRLEYSIDVEMAWRLAPRHLSVHYRPQARSVMARPLDFAGFCTRFEAKGRAQATIAALHNDPTIQSYTKADSAAATWEAAESSLDADIDTVHRLEAALETAVDGGDESQLDTLHRTYRRVFQALNARGFLDGARGGVRADAEPMRAVTAPVAAAVEPPAPAVVRSPSTLITVHENPQLTVTIPVWSRTEELADMAMRTIERVWEVARLRTEVVVIDNGSPFEREFNARIHRFPENRGVSVGWNAGIAEADAPVVCVLNSDCLVEPGWDVALHEAATTGRRIAFPYTDHGDGDGYRMPDQAGTAGWCFVMTKEVADEIGEFDTRFSPAFCEDTDYWHRAWELGIELSPVPAARVCHERRTTGGRTERQEWLLTAHRYLYGWKHGVEPMRAPPYYRREIVEYHVKASNTREASTV